VPLFLPVTTTKDDMPITTNTPMIELNNGVEMPALGLGVYQSAPEETAAAVETAIASGYRLIDTAAAYRNEAEVGEGVRRSGVDRDDVFVTTKLWISDYGYEPALKAFSTPASTSSASTSSTCTCCTGRCRATSTTRSPPTRPPRSCSPTGACARSACATSLLITSTP